ncbi:hypothetical protein E4U55_005398 [Claviceps digitariae]|nr:hypothetical protein E4U55_005398 [Claviceps digitariae]
MAAALGMMDMFGLFTGGLGLFSFVQHNFLDYRPQGVGFRFAVGLDGAGPWDAPLRQAGGQLPAIRVFNELGDQIGYQKNAKSYCSSGSTNCDVLLGGVEQQPTYTLFTANDDAICLAYITVTFPAGEKYAWAGNFGEFCGATWYYSDIFIQNDMGADKVECTWIDGNGDQPVTGIQVHWPDYSASFRGNGGDGNYYCLNPTAMTLHRDQSPSRIHVRPQKRDMFAADPSVKTKTFATSPKDAEPKADTPKKPGLRERMARDTRLIKSHAKSHTATKLCESHSSIGPSFVSYKERKFCHMDPKKLYSFCEDVKTGECWDDVKHEIVHKAEGGVVKRAAHPAVAFEKVIFWGLN